jgi:hypothetical protein
MGGGDAVVVEIHGREGVPRRGTYQFPDTHNFIVEFRIFAGHSRQVDSFFREMICSPDGACSMGVDECRATDSVRGFGGDFDF